MNYYKALFYKYIYGVGQLQAYMQQNPKYRDEAPNGADI